MCRAGRRRAHAHVCSGLAGAPQRPALSLIALQAMPGSQSSASRVLTGGLGSVRPQRSWYQTRADPTQGSGVFPEPGSLQVWTLGPLVLQAPQACALRCCLTPAPGVSRCHPSSRSRPGPSAAVSPCEGSAMPPVARPGVSEPPSCLPGASPPSSPRAQPLAHLPCSLISGSAVGG